MVKSSNPPRRSVIIAARIITLVVSLAGAEGMRHVPSYPVQAVDTTGAGDAFIGSFASFLAEGCGEADAVARANLYAALSTLSHGTQKSFVTRQRFDAEWARNPRVT